MSKVSISLDGRGLGDVIVDDVTLHNVTEVHLEAIAGKQPKLTVAQFVRPTTIDLEDPQIEIKSVRPKPTQQELTDLVDALDPRQLLEVLNVLQRPELEVQSVSYVVDLKAEINYWTDRCFSRAQRPRSCQILIDNVGVLFRVELPNEVLIYRQQETPAP